MSDAYARQIFETIREIPYRVTTSADSANENCVQKGAELVQKLTLLGYTVRGRLGEFNWRDIPLPEKLLSLLPANTDAEETHYFVEIFQNNEWRVLDPTCDSALASAGLTIGQWNGMREPALPVRRVYEAPEQAAYVEKFMTKPGIAEKYFSEFGPFLRALNGWMDEVRHGRA